MQMIFQDPYSSLNPRKTVGSIIGEPFVIHALERDDGKRKKLVQELMDTRRAQPRALQPLPARVLGRPAPAHRRRPRDRPEAQARSSPTSPSRRSTSRSRRRSSTCSRELQRELGLTIIFIAHDLCVVRHVCDRIAVMYLGKIVELAEADQLFDHPRHPYTGALLSAVPVPDPRLAREQAAPGARRRRPVADQPAAGLPLPHPLPEGARRRLRRRRAAARGQGRRQRRRLPLPADRTRRSPSGCRPPRRERRALRGRAASSRRARARPPTPRPRSAARWGRSASRSSSASATSRC